MLLERIHSAQTAAVSSLQSNSEPSRRNDELVKFRTFLFRQRPFDADKPKSSFIVRRDVRIVPIGVQRRWRFAAGPTDGLWRIAFTAVVFTRAGYVTSCTIASDRGGSCEVHEFVRVWPTQGSHTWWAMILVQPHNVATKILQYVVVDFQREQGRSLPSSDRMCVTQKSHRMFSYQPVVGCWSWRLNVLHFYRRFQEKATDKHRFYVSMCTENV